MEAKREQALVGLFVLVAGGLLIVTLVLLSGALTTGDTTFHTYFKNAGGLQPGSEVRYAGGPPDRPRQEEFRSIPEIPHACKVDFAVHPNIPVKTDSTVIITSNSPLGENFLESWPEQIRLRALRRATPSSQRNPSAFPISPTKLTLWLPPPTS